MNPEEMSDLVGLVSEARELLKAIPLATNEQPDKSSPGNLRKQYSRKSGGYNIIENLLCYSICLATISKTKKWTITKHDLEETFGEEDAKSFPKELKSLFLAACMTPITLIQPRLMYGRNFTRSTFIEAAKWRLSLMIPEPIRQLEKCIISAAMQFFPSLDHNLVITNFVSQTDQILLPLQKYTYWLCSPAKKHSLYETTAEALVDLTPQKGLTSTERQEGAVLNPYLRDHHPATSETTPSKQIDKCAQHAVSHGQRPIIPKPTLYGNLHDAPPAYQQHPPTPNTPAALPNEASSSGLYNQKYSSLNAMENVNTTNNMFIGAGTNLIKRPSSTDGEPPYKRARVEDKEADEEDTDGDTDRYEPPENDYRFDEEVDKGLNTGEEVAQTVAHAPRIHEEDHVEQQVLPHSAEDGSGTEEVLHSVEHASRENVHLGRPTLSFHTIKHLLDAINRPRSSTPTQHGVQDKSNEQPERNEEKNAQQSPADIQTGDETVNTDEPLEDSNDQIMVDEVNPHAVKDSSPQKPPDQNADPDANPEEEEVEPDLNQSTPQYDEDESIKPRKQKTSKGKGKSGSHTASARKKKGFKQVSIFDLTAGTYQIRPAKVAHVSNVTFGFPSNAAQGLDYVEEPFRAVRDL